MSTEENFALVRRFNQVFRADDDLTVLDEILAPDFVAHNGDEEVRGPDGWRKFVLDIRKESTSDIETGIDELIGNDSLVAERWWMHSSADGVAVRGHGITMHRIVGGKLQENWAVYLPES